MTCPHNGTPDPRNPDRCYRAPGIYCACMYGRIVVVKMPEKPITVGGA